MEVCGSMVCFCHLRLWQLTPSCNVASVDYVRDKIIRVFTFGSPPITTVPHGFYDGEVEEYLRSIGGLPESHPEMEPYKCDTLKAFGLPCSIVYGFVQPWVSRVEGSTVPV